MIWIDWVLWHMNHCRLFNAKSSLYIYIKYIGFGWFGFYVSGTFVDREVFLLFRDKVCVFYTHGQLDWN